MTNKQHHSPKKVTVEPTKRHSRETPPQTHYSPSPFSILAISSERLRSSDVLHLQRTIGNRATQKMLQPPPTPTPIMQAANDTADIQPLLMPLETFRERKEIAATSTSIKGVEEIYEEYKSARADEHFAKASVKLNALEEKIERMRDKTYWRSDELRDNLLGDMQRGLKEERESLQKDRQASLQELSKEFSNKDVQDDETSSQSEDSNDAGGLLEFVLNLFADLGFNTNDPRNSGRDIVEPIFRNQQQAHIITEAITMAIQFVPALEEPVLKTAFIESLCSTMLKRRPFVLHDVFNEIAAQMQHEELPTTELKDVIDSIAHDDDLTPPEKLVQISIFLWGGFHWKTQGGNDFRIWMEMKGNDKFEPSNTGSMNCWEAVLFIMIKAGIVNKSKVVEAYSLEATNPKGYYTALMNLLGYPQTKFWKDDMGITGKRPQAGDIVFFEWSRFNLKGDSMQHVALALGPTENDQDEIMSLWWGETGSILGKTTIQALNQKSHDFITFASAPVKK